MEYSADMTLRVVELYSGIGGMHWALKECGLKYEVVAAVDINNVANAVYAANFPTVRLISKCLLTLKVEDFEEFSMDMLLMSPPCQPFTSVGKQRDVEDDRTKSFLHILNILLQMTKPPRYILVENVRGFEKSQARVKLVSALKCLNYKVEEVLCCPSQFGIPNSRLRYFLIASRNQDENTSAEHCTEQTDSAAVCDDNDRLLKSSKATGKTLEESVKSKCELSNTCGLLTVGPFKHPKCTEPESVICESAAHESSLCHAVANESSLCHAVANESSLCHTVANESSLWESSSSSDAISSLNQASHCCKSCTGPVADGSHFQKYGSESNKCNGHSCTCGQVPQSTELMKISDSVSDKGLICCVSQRRNLSEFLESPSNEDDYWQKFALPKKFYRQFWVTDLVKPESMGSCCFTKRYGHYIEGAGSVIQMGSDGRYLMKYKGNENCEEFEDEIKRLGLRFFSPREIANILCFPQEFVMPDEMTLKQWYRLLGNSLNVSVVSFLLRRLTTESDANNICEHN